MTNRKLTSLRTDNVIKNGCSTVYSFGIYYFHMQVIWISKTFSKNLHRRHRLCTSNGMIPEQQHHVWYQLSWYRSSPGPVIEVIQGVPDSYLLLSSPTSSCPICCTCRCHCPHHFNCRRRAALPITLPPHLLHIPLSLCRTESTLFIVTY